MSFWPYLFDTDVISYNTVMLRWVPNSRKKIRSLLIQFNDEYLIYTRLVHYNNVIQLLLVNGYYALFLILVPFFLVLVIVIQ